MCAAEGQQCFSIQTFKYLSNVKHQGPEILSRLLCLTAETGMFPFPHHLWETIKDTHMYSLIGNQ